HDAANITPPGATNAGFFRRPTDPRTNVAYCLRRRAKILSQVASAGFGLRFASTRPSVANRGRIAGTGFGKLPRSRSVKDSWKAAIAFASSSNWDCRPMYLDCISWDDEKTPRADVDGHPPSTTMSASSREPLIRV